MELWSADLVCGWTGLVVDDVIIREIVCVILAPVMHCSSAVAAVVMASAPA